MKRIVQFLLAFLLAAPLVAQEPKIMLAKTITPVKNKWTIVQGIKAAPGMRFTLTAETVNAKKDFEICITSFPGNQVVYYNYEAQTLNHSFEAPANCKYAILLKGKHAVKLKMERTATPEQLEEAKKENYLLVNIPDSTWALNYEQTLLGYERKVMPMTKKVKYQTKKASEVIFNQSFALEPGQQNVASIEVPQLHYDDYQQISIDSLYYTLTVSDAAYQALKSKVSDALVSGVTMGVGKAARKKLGKLADQDASWKTVNNLAQKMDKIEPYAQVLEAGYDITDIGINGARPEEEDKPTTIETYMFEGDGLTKKTLQATGANGKIKSMTDPEIRSIEVPSIGGIANGAAGLITPNIKETVKFELATAQDSMLLKGNKGFECIKLKYNDPENYTTFFTLENPRSATDLKNLLTNYIYGSLMVEMVYTIDTYKDVLYFGQVDIPVNGQTLNNTATVKYRTEYIRESDMKPWYVKTSQQYVPAPVGL